MSVIVTTDGESCLYTAAAVVELELDDVEVVVATVPAELASVPLSIRAAVAAPEPAPAATVRAATAMSSPRRNRFGGGDFGGAAGAAEGYELSKY